MACGVVGTFSNFWGKKISTRIDQAMTWREHSLWRVPPRTRLIPWWSWRILRLLSSRFVFVRLLASILGRIPFRRVPSHPFWWSRRSPVRKFPFANASWRFLSTEKKIYYKLGQLAFLKRTNCQIIWRLQVNWEPYLARDNLHQWPVEITFAISLEWIQEHHSSWTKVILNFSILNWV